MNSEAPRKKLEDTEEFAEAVNKYGAERRQRMETEKNELAEIRKKFEAKPPEEQEATKEHIKNKWRAYEIMSDYNKGYGEFGHGHKGYRELFEDPLFRELPEAQELIKEERGLLEAGVSKEEINKYSKLYVGISRLFDSLRTELIWSPVKELGTYQQHERDEALSEIHRERKALEEKEK